MTRWVLFAPFAGLVILAGVLGYRLGQAGPPSETAVINHWADVYVAQAGGAAVPTDCVARPDPRPAVWMVMTCARDGAQTIFHIGQDGLAVPDAVLNPTGAEA